MSSARIGARGRVLGVDLGTKRVGLAVSDDAQKVAVGIGVLSRQADPDDYRRRLASLVVEYQAIGVVVGLPLGLSGRVGKAAGAALAEVEALRGLLGVSVETVDERFSTKSAQVAMSAGGLGGRRSRQVIDQQAAVEILQTWLDSRALRQARP